MEATSKAVETVEYICARYKVAASNWFPIERRHRAADSPPDLAARHNWTTPGHDGTDTHWIDGVCLFVAVVLADDTKGCFQNNCERLNTVSQVQVLDKTIHVCLFWLRNSKQANTKFSNKYGYQYELYKISGNRYDHFNIFFAAKPWFSTVLCVVQYTISIVNIIVKDSIEFRRVSVKCGATRDSFICCDDIM